MSKPLLRIPYTGPLPPALIIPPSAATKHGAIAALAQFLTSPSPALTTTTNSTGAGSTPDSRIRSAFLTQRDDASSLAANKPKTVLLTGAGISVASGLADYRGEKGTYTQNKSYRPIYFHEFVASHESRKRYWARSFLGWRGLLHASPNATHYAIRDLGRLGLVDSVITQNVDSFHPRAHPALPTIELHGFLRSLVCLSCKRLMDREAFQTKLARLNPAWAEFLQQLQESGALDTENPTERRRLGFRTNPDGDADVPGAPYTTFRYPACPHCLKRPPILSDGSKGHVDVDADGAWILPGPKTSSSSTAAAAAGGNGNGNGNGVGILKPNVIMFGESIPLAVKLAADSAIDSASKILVLGSSLATYSAWRLVKRAHDRGMDIAVLNLGGIRKEEVFFRDAHAHGQYHQHHQHHNHHHDDHQHGHGHEQLHMTPGSMSTSNPNVERHVVRASLPTEDILPGVVEYIRSQGVAVEQPDTFQAGV